MLRRLVALTILAIGASPSTGAAAQLDARSCLPPAPAGDASLLASFYPAEARQAGKEGSATVVCGHTEHGRLTHCALLAEDPPGYGLGAAALKLAAAAPGNADIRISPEPKARTPVTFQFALEPPYVRPDIFWKFPTIITQPDWVVRPSSSDLGRFYPRHTTGVNPAGRVTLACTIDVQGRPDCTVATEDPIGYGFGGAALKLAATFQFKPMLVDGQPCAGGRIDIPVNFPQAP